MMRHTYLKHKSNWIKEQINLCMCSLTIQHSSGWRVSSRSEEAILRQTSCVMFVCVFVFVCMVTQLQAELGILNYHISTSREKPKGYTHMPMRKHTYMCIYTHTHTHTHHPHISLELQAPCWEAQTHQSRAGAAGGGVVEEEGRAVGLWRSMRLVSDIETKVKHKPCFLFCYRPCSDRQQHCVTERSLLIHFHETTALVQQGWCCSGLRQNSWSRFNLYATQRLPATHCVSQLKYEHVSIPHRLACSVELVVLC